MYKLREYPLNADGQRGSLTVGSGVVLIQRGHVLVVREFEDEPYSFPGGTVESEESAESAARREVMEELSLKIQVHSDPYIYQFQRYKSGIIEYVLLFHFPVLSIDGKLSLGHDAKQMAWLDPNDLRPNTYPNVLPVARYFVKKYGPNPDYTVK